MPQKPVDWHLSSEPKKIKHQLFIKSLAHLVNVTGSALIRSCLLCGRNTNEPRRGIVRDNDSDVGVRVGAGHGTVARGKVLLLGRLEMRRES